MDNQKIYVAIIGRLTNLGVGMEHPQAFTSTDKDALLRNVVQKRVEMERKSGGTSYDIFVGEITHQVQVPIEYKLVSLETSSK
jgi:hypothetical protein